MPTIIDEAVMNETKDINLNTISLNFAKFDVKFEDDPEFGKIQEMMEDRTNRKKDKPEIAKRCFDYLMDKKMLFTDKDKRPQMDLILANLAAIDLNLATNVEIALNKDPHVGGVIKKINDYKAKHGLTDKLPPVDAKMALVRQGVDNMPGNTEVLIETEAEADTRIQNLKKIYEDLHAFKSRKMFGSNTPQYENMVKSIKQVLDYSKFMGGKGATHDVLKVMLDKVAECAEAYVEAKEIVPSTPAGKNRQELALAALCVTDKDKAQKQVDRIASHLKEIDDTKARNFEIMLGGQLRRRDQSEFLSMDKIAQNVNIRTDSTYEEELTELSRFMSFMKKECFKDRGICKLTDASVYCAAKSVHDNLAKLTGAHNGNINTDKASIRQQASKLRDNEAFMKAYNDVVYNGDPNNFGKDWDIIGVDVDAVYTKYMKNLVEIEKEKMKVEKQSEENKNVENVKKNEEVHSAMHK